MGTYQNIEIKKKNSLAYVIINRPELRNALSKETLQEILGALNELSDDETVGCVIFTGKGEKSFAAGADIAQLRQKTALDVFKLGGIQEVFDRIEMYDKPTIAMVNGFALGGGCELALACDIRVAALNAKFGLPELNLSIIPGGGGTQRLARIVGKGKALDIILTGKIIDGEEAYRIGLVSEVVSMEELEAKAEEVAGKILTKGPLAVKLAKLAVKTGFETDQKSGLLIEKLAQAVLFSTEDKIEGTSAFLEKRSPKFTSK
ncbi:enoyl-CoA hydratase/isomerase family protein [Peribacillus frigoritolerans]|uniref:enoyl-CoA hydratase/isomerase family protein n=1 Tax=Peribacillus frigoritolerans TaxID=450367 RepID=UPI002415A99E|nr:enoyl-CoA hydratase-related protein [Peribacillus frigoritolerans]MDG4849477.1 enoyl-CoA hydratase-related protein [Peribacillus frigoritolerans]MED3833101.1 enoyl-CoA hydratase-related protein [Peribacillus frigoritolerans]MED3849169.1 enoyl-CoA hydratase-related protein [Peribacillus frigoritolerans]